MEILGLICAGCILLAWGPRVLLAVIVIPTMLFLAMVMTKSAREWPPAIQVSSDNGCPPKDPNNIGANDRPWEKYCMPGTGHD